MIMVAPSERPQRRRRAGITPQGGQENIGIWRTEGIR